VEIGTHKPLKSLLLLQIKRILPIGRAGNIFLLIMAKPIKNTSTIMRSILYIIAVILIIGWLLGVFYWSATGLIHILIVLAVIALLLGIIRRA
jgi:hypothetical protein